LTRSPATWRTALAAFVLLAGFFAREALFEGRTFFLRDLHLQWLGQAESFVQAVGSGAWPLWDPYVSFGQPMLANPNAQILYPLTWLNLVMRPGTYYTVYFVLHLIGAGLGVFALARRWNASLAGSLLAGAAFVASGPFLSLGNLWNHLAGAAWMPWTLLAADHALAGSRRGLAAWAACTAGAILAGSPEFALLALLPAAGLVLEKVEWKSPFGSENRRLLLVAGLAVSLGALLAAAQILPALELVRRSSRWGMSVESRAYWSAHPALLLQALVPLRWDALPWTTGLRAMLFEGREPFLLSLYLGAPTLLLAAAALFTKAIPHRAVLGVTAGACTLLALGPHTPLYAAAAAAFPPLQAVRYPTKALVLTAFCLTLLAGFAFDAWRARALRMKAVAAAGGALAAGALAAAFMASSPHSIARGLVVPGVADEARALAPLAWAAARVAGLAIVLVLVALSSLRWARAAHVTAALLASVVVLDLASFHAQLNPTAPAGLLSWRPDALKAVRQEDGGRLFVYDYYAWPGMSRRHLGRDAAYMVPAPGSGRELWRAALALRAYPVAPVAAAYRTFDSFGRDLLGLQPLPLARLNAVLFRSEGTPAFHRLLRIGAVSQVLALHADGLEELEPAGSWTGPFFEDIRLFRVPGRRPRAYLAEESRTGDIETLLDPSFDPARAVVLERPRPEQAAAMPIGQVLILDLRADRVRLEVDAAAPGLLVLVDAYDPGWRATVDGARGEVVRANVAFRAVPVPAGRHTVEMVYRPPSVLLGLALSLAALTATARIAFGRSAAARAA
jgi:hypothetical protein